MDFERESRVALFIDAENFVLGCRDAGLPVNIKILLDLVSTEGLVAVARAYSDWTRQYINANEFYNNVIELTQLPSNRGKNTADIQIVADALEMALGPNAPDSFVIVGGDRDFVPLVQKLKRHGKRVVGISLKISSGRALETVCDKFIYYDSLFEPMPRDEPEPAGKRGSNGAQPERGRQAPAAEQRLAFELLVRAILSLERNGRDALGSNTRQIMVRLSPSFDLREVGFSGFKQFVEAAEKEGFIAIESSGSDFRLQVKSGAAVAEASGSSPEVELDFSSTERAVETYRRILEQKRVPLAQWERRETMVRALWERFAEAGSLSLSEMSRAMLDSASAAGFSLPARAVEKLGYTLKIARAVVPDEDERSGSGYWNMPYRPDCDADEALRRLHTTYIRGIHHDYPAAILLPDALAVLLFDEDSEERQAELRGLLEAAGFEELPAAPPAAKTARTRRGGVRRGTRGSGKGKGEEEG